MWILWSTFSIIHSISLPLCNVLFRVFLDFYKQQVAIIFLFLSHYAMMQDDFEDFPLLISESFPVWVAASVLCPVWIATLFAVVFGPFNTSLVLFSVVWPFLEFGRRFKEEDEKSSTQSWKSSSAYAIESCLLSL